MGMAEGAGGEQPGAARHAMAVALETGPVEVAGLGEVHLHAVHDLIQFFLRDGETLDMRRKSLGYRVLRFAGEKIRNLRAPPGELGRGELRVGGLVDDVIDLAAEGVQRRDRAPALGRQEEKREVEARSALARFLLS